MLLSAGLSNTSVNPALLLGAGICLFTAFSHILVWAANRQARANLLFSILSIVVMGMMLLLIISERPEAPTTTSTLYEILKAALWALLAWLPALQQGGRRLRLAFLLSCSFSFWALLVLSFCLISKVVDGNAFLCEAGTPGQPLALSWAVLQAAAIAHLLYHAYHLHRNSEHHLFVLALLLFAGTAIHDTLLALDVLPQVSLTEFGFLFFVLAMSRDLARVLHRHATTAAERGRAVQLIAENIPATVAYLDKDLNIAFANSACLKGFGAENSDTVLGRPLQDFLSEEQFNQARPFIKRASAGASVRFETSETGAKNETIWTDISILPDMEASGELKGFFLLAYDVTPHRAATQAAQESEKQFRSLINACPLGILTYRADENDDLILTGSNPAADTLLGSMQRHTGKQILDIFPNLKDTEIPKRYLAAARDGATWHSQVTYKQDGISGTYDFVVFQTIPGTIAVMFQDISEKLRQEQELRRLAAAIDQAAETVVITDADGTIQYVNPAFVDISGYSAEEAIGNNPSVLKSGVQDDAFYKHLWNTITSGKTWRGRFVNVRKNGERYTEQAVISPVFNPAGEITNFVAVKQDVSDALQMELQLRQSQKMEAIGQLAGGVAHDFNNILQAIEGYTELADLELPEGSTVSSYIKEIKGAAGRASNLTRQLLAFSRSEHLKPRPLSLNTVVTELLKMLHRILGEHITLTIHDAPAIHTVMADPGQVEQILLNLCINARDAMPNGGAIDISCGNATFDQKFCARNPWAKPGTYAFVQVRDTGHGIPKDVRERIFEPFFTTKEIGEGTGLGLATVYAIIQRHEGLIELTTDPGEGASFTIYLPAIDELDPDLPRPEREPRPQGGCETLLLAEDDPMVRMLAVTILERAGYKLHIATDGDEAVRLLDSFADAIQLAILDVVMPHRMGTEVLEEIRKRGLEFPVIFSSGYGYPTDEAADATTDFTILRKPYTPDALLSQVRRLLDS